MNFFNKNFYIRCVKCGFLKKKKKKKGWDTFPLLTPSQLPHNA